MEDLELLSSILCQLFVFSYLPCKLKLTLT